MGSATLHRSLRSESTVQLKRHPPGALKIYWNGRARSLRRGTVGVSNCQRAPRIFSHRKSGTPQECEPHGSGPRAPQRREEQTSLTLLIHAGCREGKFADCSRFPFQFHVVHAGIGGCVSDLSERRS